MARGADRGARGSRRRGCGSRRAGGCAALRQLLAGGARDGRRRRSRGRCSWRSPRRARPAVDLRHERQLDLVADLRLQRRSAASTGQAGGPGGGAAVRAAAAAAACSAAPTGRSACSTRALGGQAGWLLGFALVSGVAVLVGSRLRRGDARTGWLIAVGGAFLRLRGRVLASPQGIFHPYYVSLLAPFTAALVGGGVGQFAPRRALDAVARAARGRCAACVVELVVHQQHLRRARLGRRR